MLCYGAGGARSGDLQLSRIPLATHDEDEGALICSCFGISDAKIRRVILENNLTTAEQVTSYVKAGGGCGSCLADIDDLIAAVQRESHDLGVKVATEMATAKEQPTYARSLKKQRTSQRKIKSKTQALLSGEQIMMLRKSLQLSQRSLAQMTGKSQSWIRDIENGRFQANPEDQVLLRKVLQVELNSHHV